MTSVAVIGGGIGGLTAAIALRGAGIDVDVYEQASTINEIGAGLGLFPNALRVLDNLGLKEEIAAQGVLQTRVTFRRWDDGRVIGEVDERGLEAEFGQPHYTVHRTDLMKVLKRAVPPHVIHLGKRLVSVSQDSSTVQLEFADGSSAEADAMIGADGIRSLVAQQLGLATRPVSSGFVVYRGLISADKLPPRDLDDSTAITQWLGPEKHFSHYWVRSGRLFNFLAVVQSTMRSEEEVWTAAGDPQEVRAAYPGWHSSVQVVLQAIEKVTLFGLFHRVAERQWHKERVALVGDAVHPMLPFGGQGAGMAMEDAETLAVLLADSPMSEIPKLFEIYSDLRWERARRCQIIASEHGASWEVPDGPEQEARDARIAKASSESGAFFAPSKWLYAYDVREAARSALKAHRASAARVASSSPTATQPTE